MTKPTIKEFKANDIDKKLYSQCTITQASIMDMRIMIPKHDKMFAIIANITWLCRSDDNLLFTISSNYVAEDSEDKAFMLQIPFLSEKNYKNYNITNDILTASLQHYLTDMKMVYSIPNNIESTDMSIYGLDITERENTNQSTEDRVVKFNLTHEVYSMFKFIDYFMYSGTIDSDELNNAVKSATVSDPRTKLVDVKNIKLLNMYNDPENKNSDTLLLILEITVPHKSGVDKYNLALSVNYQNKFKAKKFKNNDKPLEYYTSEEYFEKSNNNYSYEFKFFDNDIKPSDEEGGIDTLIAYSTNIDYDTILFAFDQDCINKIIEQVEAF